MSEGIPKITIRVVDRNELLARPVEIGMDEKWSVSSPNFDRRMKSEGIYVLHIASPSRVIYVGKTRGPSMDFQTRLYRHATESASQNSPVYKVLKRINQETGTPILASLITTEQLRNLFQGTNLTDAAMVDIYEQLMIHVLRPEIQTE